MRCLVCIDDKARTEFEAPDAVVPICKTCLGAMASRRLDHCSACGGRSAVLKDGKCAGCRTDARLNRGG